MANGDPAGGSAERISRKKIAETVISGLLLAAISGICGIVFLTGGGYVLNWAMSGNLVHYLDGATNAEVGQLKSDVTALQSEIADIRSVQDAQRLEDFRMKLPLDVMAYFKPSVAKDKDDDPASITFRRASGSSCGGYSDDICLIVTYIPQSENWQGLHWLYPADNHGNLPGMTISGPARLTVKISAGDEDVIADFVVGGIRDPSKRYNDALDIAKPAVRIAKHQTIWVTFDIEQRDVDIIRGLGVFLSKELNQNGAVLMIQSVEVDTIT